MAPPTGPVSPKKGAAPAPSKSPATGPKAAPKAKAAVAAKGVPKKIAIAKKVVKRVQLKTRKANVPARKLTARAPTLKSKITPGTILILLAGRFRGRRVIFLKQLTSGLLLVTGPYAVNGVPTKRVNQRYVIATSAKIDVSGVDVSKYTDAYFARKSEKKAKKSEDEFFAAEASKPVIDAARKSDQKALDAALASKVGGKNTLLYKYLGARFTLTHGMKPHAMKF